jgi:catechol 2,3-dioxygenase-like lactoylglutathione lyase family enzyme
MPQAYPQTLPQESLAMPSILDHISLGVSDYARAKRFYDAVLPTLGISLIWEKPQMASYGIGTDDQFGLQVDDGAARAGTHLAFRAKDAAEVDAFHKAALAAGGRDNGPPGLRAYSGSYYAAFIFDPDGNRIETVFHGPEQQ